MNARLSEVPVDLAVYLPFDDPESEVSVQISVTRDFGILADVSINCWHLTPLHEAQPFKVSSEAPVGHDSLCVNHVLSKGMPATIVERGIQTTARPLVAEYGDMQIAASGSMEGSEKRACSYIAPFIDVETCRACPYSHQASITTA